MPSKSKKPKPINVYPLKTKLNIFDDTIGMITGINIVPEGVVYNIEYFFEGQLIAV